MITSMCENDSSDNCVKQQKVKLNDLADRIREKSITNDKLTLEI